MPTGFHYSSRGYKDRKKNPLQFGIGSRKYGTRRLVCELGDREIAVEFLAQMQILQFSLGLEQFQVPRSLYSIYASGLVGFKVVLACNVPPTPIQF